MDDQAVLLKLNDHEHEIGSLKHRMKDCEDQQKAMNKLVNCVDRLALNMENMLAEQKEQGKRLTQLEQAPSDDFKHYKRIIAGCLITGVIGVILGAVFALIIK